MEVIYLGHVFSEAAIGPDSKLIDEVKNFPWPKSPKQVKSSLGLANSYWRFLPDFESIAASINRLVRQEVKFEWNEVCENAFERLKGSWFHRPLSPFISNFIWSLLYLQTLVVRRCMPYWSRRDSRWHTDWNAKMNYSTSERELLALTCAIKIYRWYLLGRPFKIFTDHQALKRMLKARGTTRQMLCLHQKLSDIVLAFW